LRYPYSKQAAERVPEPAPRRLLERAFAQVELV
jgi:hypothetical protein